MGKARKPMSYIRALKILGLNDVFTGDDLKKAYRNLAREYHPDNYMQKSESEQKDAEEKMKKVNEAKDYFDKLYENTGSYQKYDPNYVREYRLSKAFDLYTYFEKENPEELDYPEYYSIYKENITVYASTYFDKIMASKNIMHINKLYDEGKKQILSQFFKFKTRYFKEYDVTVNDDELNYECPIDEFFKQMKDIVDRIINERIQQINDAAKKYETDPNYAIFKSKLDKILEEALAKAKEEKYKNIEYLILDLQLKYKQIFDEHNNIIGLFTSLKNYFVNKYGDSEVQRVENNEDVISISEQEKEIILKIKKYQENYLTTLDFNQINESVKKLVEVVEILRRKDIVSMQSAEIKNIFNIVTNNFHQAMKRFNETLDSKSMGLSLEIYTEFLDFYSKLLNGTLEMNKWKALTNLTFKDFNKDRIILYSLFNRETIYIAKDNKYESRFVVVEAEDANKVAFKYLENNECKQEIIPKTEFAKLFISLSEFLKNAEFIGRSIHEYITSDKVALYENNNLTLYINKDGTFEVGYSNHQDLDTERDITPYFDKEYTKKAIKDSLRKLFNSTLDMTVKR